MTDFENAVRAENSGADDRNALRLDIGCGLNKRDGFIGIDRSDNVDADYVVDVETEPLPFDDNSVDEIYCAHLVEHLHNLIHFMNECHRVLKPGATMTILAPYYTAIQASQDPTHVRFINERTFAYFTSEYNGIGAESNNGHSDTVSNNGNGSYHDSAGEADVKDRSENTNGQNPTFDYGICGLYEIDSIDFTYINLWAKPWLPNRIRNWARKHLFNVAVDITVKLHTVQ